MASKLKPAAASVAASGPGGAPQQALPENNPSTSVQASALSLHEITREYADFTEPELTAMRESLRTNGLINPITTWRGQIVDGRHRDMLCRELGIEPRYIDVTE